MTEKEAYIAFNLLQNIGSAGVERLIAKHGGIVQAWENVENKTGRDGKVVNLEEELEKAAKYRVFILTPVDKEYPKRLLDTRGHPLCLYLKGSVEALQVASVAMVGTRRSTIYGEDMAYKIARDLAGDGWCIVSGLALGIDGQSHRGALDGGGLTVGVLGSALDEFYPEENRQLARDIAKGNGAVISEFPPNTPPSKTTFELPAAQSCGRRIGAWRIGGRVPDKERNAYNRGNRRQSRSDSYGGARQGRFADECRVSEVDTRWRNLSAQCPRCRRCIE